MKSSLWKSHQRRFIETFAEFIVETISDSFNERSK